MLAEAFFSKLMYTDIMSNGKQETLQSNHKPDSNSWRDHLENVNKSALETESQRVLNIRVELKKDGGHPARSADVLSGAAGQTSEAQLIPRRVQDNDKQLDLYTSWPNLYGSMYENYPDLHIGGDHILNKKDSGCVLDLDCELQDGPVLCSIDIPSGATPPAQILERPPTLSMIHGEESRERISMLPTAPFSSSALNGYIESKIQELYKQLLAENMTRFCSPSTLLSSSILMNNVNQLSMQLSQERYMEHGKARDAILNYLRSVTGGVSSEFFTPVLHISNIENKTNSEAEYPCL